MRLAFQDGEVHMPQRYTPNLYHRGYRGGYGMRGLGDAVSDLSASDSSSNLVNFAATLPTASITGASTANMLGGSVTADIVGGAQAGLMVAAPFTEPAAPFVLAAAQLIGPIASMFKGCGQTCTMASQIADRSQQAADQIMANYKSQPIHYRSIQQAALAAMQDVMKYLQGACSSQTLGAAGQRCISERLDPNACVIKDAQGGCHNFWIDYINPITNDPAVVPDPPSAASSALSGVGGLPMPLILGGAGILAYVLFAGDGK